MPVLAKAPVAFVMNKLGGYDNRLPRLQQTELNGFGARALAAHNNCFEAIAYFAPTVLLVLAMDAHTVYTVYLCLAFVGLRILYVISYWANWHFFRSSFWLLGMATVFAHYVMIF